MITIKVFQTGNIHEEAETIGVTKVSQVEDAASAANMELSDDEIQALETLGDQAGLNVIRYWKKKMQKKGGCFNEQDFSSLFLCQRRYCQSGG